MLFVVPGINDTRRRGVAFPRTLVLEDRSTAEQVPSVKRVAPQISSSQVVQAGARSATSSISGITPEFLTVRSFDVARRFINQEDLEVSAMWGDRLDLSTKLFPTDHRLANGCASVVNPSQLSVMVPKGAVFGSNLDENAYIPLSIMVTRLTGRDPTFGKPELHQCGSER